mmetsp:Transcript_2856/g.5370  ORF Transcript_2856/g.5370 Transcript_2856/m.5370 type:complete len:236 (+) Transcript_2856:350-1057(+)
MCLRAGSVRGVLQPRSRPRNRGLQLQNLCTRDIVQPLQASPVMLLRNLDAHLLGGRHVHLVLSVQLLLVENDGDAADQDGVEHALASCSVPGGLQAKGCARVGLHQLRRAGPLRQLASDMAAALLGQRLPQRHQHLPEVVRAPRLANKAVLVRTAFLRINVPAAQPRGLGVGGVGGVEVGRVGHADDARRGEGGVHLAVRGMRSLHTPRVALAFHEQTHRGGARMLFNGHEGGTS